MAARLRTPSSSDRERAAHEVVRQVLAMPEYVSAGRVALYAALPDEIPTGPLLEAVRASGREILLPRSAPAGPAFASVDSLDTLRPGPLGVLEPPSQAAVASLDSRDLVFVPGIAFDAAGGRLGRGLGWYDRALSRIRPSLRVFGVGFAFQLVDVVPTAPHDRAVEGFVSEQGVVRARPRDRAPDPG
jgi:5-formyltetrahydrofolate cyclo-ligase